MKKISKISNVIGKEASHSVVAIAKTTSHYYLEEAYQQRKQPITLTLGDKRYTNILDTENFLCDDDINQQIWTPTNIIKRHFKSEYLTCGRNQSISMPAPVYLISASGRQRIMRAFLYHKYKSQFPIFPKELIDFLDKIPHGEGSTCAKREFNFCRWATNYNDEAAAALMICTGLTSKGCTTLTSVEQAAIYRLKKQDDGIELTITDDTNVEDRFFAGCTIIKQRALELRTKAATINRLGEKMFTITEDVVSDVASKALETFYSYNSSYLSLPKDYSNVYRTSLREFTELAFSDFVATDEILYLDIPEVPPVTEWEAPETYFIAFDDFIVTSQNAELNKTLGFNANYENIIKKAKSNGLTYDQLYTKTFLRTIYSSNPVDSAIKNGFIVKEGNKFRIACLADDFK